MIRQHDSQIVFGLEQLSDKLMTVDLNGVVEKSGVKVKLAAVIKQHDSQIADGLEQSREEGKDQESIQSGTIPDPVHQLGK